MEESLRELWEAQTRFEKTTSEAKASQEALASQLRALASEKEEVERAHAAGQVSTLNPAPCTLNPEP